MCDISSGHNANGVQCFVQTEVIIVAAASYYGLAIM